MLLSSLVSYGLLCALPGTWASAQADPFQRGAPPQVFPSVRAGTAAVTVPGAAAPTSQTGTVSAGASTPVGGVFAAPRASSDGSQTRVVFDLTPGVTYTLTPTFGGLRLDVKGARVVPTVRNTLGPSVTEYRAGGGQVTLVTPFPLGLTEGWRASEATVASGARVLILEFGPTLAGGASAALRGLVRPTALPPTPDERQALSAPIGTALAQQLPPGDTVAPVPRSALPAPAPALPGHDPEKPSALSGRAPGNPQPGASLVPPRLGKNPGMTRVVLDLPPGTGYRLVPAGLGLRIELTGVSAAPLSAQNVSPEVRSWRYDPVTDGVNVTLNAAGPLTERSGWRAQLVPPTPGSDRSRLAIDLSPALANLTPLNPREKVVAAVPPMRSLGGTALLALSATLSQPRVVIDPGHGGRDPGAQGSISEKQVTLAVALRVRDLLRAAGVDAVLTRDTDRELNPVKNTDLVMRAQMGTPGTQLFLSIHVNSMEPVNALRGYGVETWWNPNHPLSSTLAGIIEKNVVGATGAYDRGLRSNRSLAVLRNSRIPAALVEIGYTSHPVDGLNLKDDNYLDRVALGIAQGIREALVSGVAAGGAAGGAEN
ncbi:N-acetylmuramoyl-L-alanine amidase family protein [Deinococcus hopiensis]|nr:N-acetylmuramoyl-L-alanine amidase [Deinococcus hopiensis]